MIKLENVSTIYLMEYLERRNLSSQIYKYVYELFDKYDVRNYQKLKENGVKKVESGSFGADMKVTLLNDGPVTIILDSEVIKPKG